MPDHIPKVEEVGASSAPLTSAAFFIGDRCKPYNEDYMLCKHEAGGRGELDCLKEGRRVTRCAASVYVRPFMDGPGGEARANGGRTALPISTSTAFRNSGRTGDVYKTTTWRYGSVGIRSSPSIRVCLRSWSVARRRWSRSMYLC